MNNQKKSTTAKDARAALMEDEAGQSAELAKREAETGQDTTAKDTAPPLIALGKRGNYRLYFSRPHKCVYELMPEKHSRLSLLAMASLEDYAAWLRPDLPPDAVEKFEADILHRAAPALFKMTGGKMFDPAALRARGIWLDKETGRALYNSGRECYLAAPADSHAAPVCVDAVRPPHIYTAAPALPPPDAPLTYEQGRAVVEFLSARSWAFKNAGVLLAGWLAAAVLAGALPYRPHVWITAPRNTGKTFLRDDIVSLLGNFSCVQDGAMSTPAALRAELNGAALPVISDEQETHAGDMHAAASVEKKLDLARLASNGRVVKHATQGGGVRDFLLLSCFMFLSVDNSLKRDTDSSRWILLDLRRASFDELEKILAKQAAARAKLPANITPRIIARLMQELPAMLNNIAALERALRVDGNIPRRAELMGCMLAGAHALTHGGGMTDGDIKACCLIAKQYAAQESPDNDFTRCIDCLRACAVVHNGARWSVEMLCAEYRRLPDGESRDGIRRALASLGLKYTPGKRLHIQTGLAFVRAIWRGTEYESRAISVLAAGCCPAAPVNEYGVKITSAKLPGNVSPRRAISIPCHYIEPAPDTDDDD